MRRILPFALALLLPALSPAGASTALAQQAPPEAAGQSQPNWPPSVEDWNTGQQESKGGNPNEAAERGLTSPEVQKNQEPPPTEQGTRAPSAETAEPEAETGNSANLYTLLSAVRQAPPTVDGKRTPRPNPLASEPAKEMQPDPAGNPESLFPEGYIE